MCDRDVLQCNVEFLGALEEFAADAVRYLLTLCDQLGRVELRDDRLENFIADGGEDTLVVVLAEVLMVRSVVGVVGVVGDGNTW